MNFLEIDHFQFKKLFAVLLMGRGGWVNGHYVNLLDFEGFFVI